MRGDTFRDVMAGVCAPVTVITTILGQKPHGTTVSAFASLSLEPPMVSVALDHRSQLLAAIRAAGRFGVNVLRYGQQDLATRFARSGIDRFRDTAWELDRGLPRLAGCGSWIVCELADSLPGGDHVLLLGHVRHSCHTSAAPLVYAQRTFGTHSGSTAAWQHSGGPGPTPTQAPRTDEET